MDVYQIVTQRIIEELEKGQIPWKKPWSGTSECISHTTGKPYSLLNQMLLGKPGEYLTFAEVKKEGGYVKAGEKGSLIVFWKPMQYKETDEEGNEKIKEVPMLRYYYVFHIDQCEGIKPKFETKTGTDTLNKSAEDVVADYLSRANGLKLEHIEQNQAFYSPSSDRVVLPLREQFENEAEYYSTEFHELTHSTGHASRLARFDQDSKIAAFGSEDYSKEELIAEIGAATLCNTLKLETESSFRNSAAYIQSWIKALKNDRKMIVSASSKASKAVNLILGIEEG